MSRSPLPASRAAASRGTPMPGRPLPRRRSRAIAFAFLSLLLSPAVRGQSAADADAVIHLPPWTIEAPAEGTLPPTLSPGISVIGARESAFHPYTTLRGALGSLPGLILQDSFGGFDPPRISVRGSGLQSAAVSRGIVQRIDGLPLNLADGTFNSAQLEPALAALFATRRTGTDPVAATTALGGSLDFGLPRHHTGARILAMAGSFGLRRAVAEAGAASASTSAWAGFTHTRSDGFRENSAQDRSVFAGTLRHRASDALELGFALYAANPRLDVPGPLDRETALHAPESILPIVAADRPHRETEVLRLTLEAGWQQADTALRAALGLQQTRDDFRQLRANGTSASDSDDLHLLLEARHHIAAHEVRGGFAIAAGNRHLTRRANINGSDGPVFADLRLYANHLTFWCEDSIRLHDTLTLQGGLSASCYERRARPATGAPPATPSGSVDAALLAPRIQLTWTPTRALALFAGWSRAFEPPTFDDLLPRTGRPPNLGLAFNPLEAQRASTTEIGIRGGTETLRYEVTFYHAHWRDELLRLADATGTPLGTRNAGPTTHRGIESALRWRLLQAHQTLDLILTHTWSEATFDADPVFGDNHLAGLPRHAGSAELQFADRQGPFAALAAAWIGGTTWADHANRLGYDGHLIINAHCGWRDPRGWTLYAEVTNLFDEAYIASTAGVLDIARNPAATTIFLPGSPRRWQVGLEWRW